MLKCVLFIAESVQNMVPNAKVFYDLMEKNEISEKDLRYFRRKLSKWTIVVVRYSQGKLVNSRPCWHCARILKLVGIKNVVYSVEGGLVKEKMNQFETNHVSTMNRHRFNRD